MSYRHVPALFLAVLAAPAMLSAQAVARSGAWMRVGGSNGWGSCATSAGSCLTDATAPAVVFSGGAVVGTRFLVGLDLEAWRGTALLNGSGTTQSLGFLLVDGSWYPSMTHGWFLRGGLGTTELVMQNSSGNRLTSFGAAAGFGTGYDLPVSGSLAFTPYVSYTAALSSSADSAGGERLRGKLFQVGAAISWY